MSREYESSKHEDVAMGDESTSRSENCPQPNANRPFTLKKWNAAATWCWDVDCDTCAICRVHLMEECLRCQAETSSECVCVWGECNHSFHNCCMAAWIKMNPRCPLCQQVCH
ncbi:hypothetical protein WR25_13448 isoform B [Diploscapter pachys]|uniref:RING-type domain-containing protein n=1 Tax=Diploscapter pachys TaxID=2018661 RepID=A0A2A2KGQ9_9BILA|nr:hypothetical protein WR25_13448 isoform B [Diploscapter pachys]